MKSNKLYKTQENYTSYFPHIRTITPSDIRGNEMTIDANKNLLYDRPTTRRFVNDSYPLETTASTSVYSPMLNPDTNPAFTANKMLMGGANPKTAIPPVIVPPAMALDYWKTNNLVKHSGINSESQQEAFQSGFQVFEDCSGFKQTKENYENEDVNVNNKYNNNNMYNKRNASNYSSVTATNNTAQDSSLYSYPYRVKEDSYLEKPNTNSYNLTTKYDIENVNTSCGYNSNQIKYGLPSNYPSGPCQLDPSLTEYNKNLFTQIIEPGVYSVNQVNEPINSNIGISYTQEFEPTSVSTDGNEIMFTEHDPNVIEPVYPAPEPQTINTANVYDPRFSGYGTSYRTYLDKQLGQTKFMYDDVNAIRMPNYITRNYIDNKSFGDTYEPLSAKNKYGNEFNDRIRAMANESFASDALTFRTELQERLMRKQNANAWQQRVAPINKSSQYMLGGFGACK